MRGVFPALGIVVVLSLMVLSIACGMASYNECRRIHPWWYCANGR
jgi:hypothetical protein